MTPTPQPQEAVIPSEGAGKYRKKPVVIDAIQWTGSNLAEVIYFTDGRPKVRSHFAGMMWEQYEDLVAREGLRIFTREDGPDSQVKHYASVGDYIISGVQAELYACKPDIFAATYEPVKDDPSIHSTCGIAPLGDEPKPSTREAEAPASEAVAWRWRNKPDGVWNYQESRQRIPNTETEPLYTHPAPSPASAWKPGK